MERQIKNMEHPVYTIFAVIIVIFLALGIGSKVIKTFDTGSEFMDKGDKKIATLATALDESDYTKYDGVIVSGADVISFIKSQMSQDAEVCIDVITPKGTTAYLYTDGTLATKSNAKMASTTSKKSSAYINPTASFLGSNTRDASGAITYVSFTQQ